VLVLPQEAHDQRHVGALFPGVIIAFRKSNGEITKVPTGALRTG
jgi:hypothetical protein